MKFVNQIALHYLRPPSVFSTTILVVFYMTEIARERKRARNFVIVYFVYLSSVSNRLSAVSLVFTLSSTGTGGGGVSGIGRQTNIIVFLFIRLTGMLGVNKVLSNKLPNAVSARTISCVLPFGVGFRNNVPTPLSLKLPSFFTKILHLKEKRRRS